MFITNSRLPAVACMATSLLTLAACSGGQGAPGPGAGGRPPAEVGVVTLQAQTVTLTRELPGRTTPYLVAEVRPQVSGIVKERLFTEGGLVKAGQPLYQLDDAVYRANVATARAELDRAEATLHAATLSAKRSAELRPAGLVSAQDHENTEAARLRAEADVAAARAALERARIDLDRARITSPIAGYIGKSSVTRGALVTANQDEPLATVQQLDPIYVDLTQPSSEWLELRQQLAAGRVQAATGLPVEILLEDGSRHAQDGRLAFSEVTVDPSTGSYTLRVVVPNPDKLLLPGIYTRAVIALATREDAILVPQRAVTRDPKGNAAVMLLSADGKVEARPIVVSRALGDQWLVEQGLQPGEQVIIDGLQKIAPGMPAQAAAATPAADQG